MRRAIAAMCAACLLSACAFSSEESLFGADSAAMPFDDGDRFELREHLDNPDEERIELTYRVRGSGYDIIVNGEEDRPMEALFVAVPDTPEEDYVAQVRVIGEEPARTFAFVWRSGGLFRVIMAPGALDDSAAGREALARLCRLRPNGECHFDSTRAVLDFYHAAVYPTVVHPDSDWHGLVYQIPLGAAPSPQESPAGKQ